MNQLKPQKKLNKRIILKLSGEAFKQNDQLFAADFAQSLIRQLKTVINNGYEIIIVLGGGNICRSRLFLPFKSENYVSLDYAGMLATVINTIALKEVFRHENLKVPVLSMINLDVQIIDYFNVKLANKLLQKHKILIVGGGIGVPSFTTDTAASVLADQLHASQILLGKKNVDGVFDKDPQQFKNAKRYQHITYQNLIAQKLKVFDLTAASFNLDKSVELLVFNLSQPNAICDVLNRKGKFTVISNE